MNTKIHILAGFSDAHAVSLCGLRLVVENPRTGHVRRRSYKHKIFARHATCKTCRREYASNPEKLRKLGGEV